MVSVAEAKCVRDGLWIDIKILQTREKGNVGINH
jgi:hypothetical protein